MCPYPAHGAMLPNGSRLSCGRAARQRKGVGRQSVPRQGHNTPLPLKRSPPASFKRLLGSPHPTTPTGATNRPPLLCWYQIELATRLLMEKCPFFTVPTAPVLVGPRVPVKSARTSTLV